MAQPLVHVNTDAHPPIRIPPHLRVCACPHVVVPQVGLLIIDEIHLLGADRGPVLEVIVSRSPQQSVVLAVRAFPMTARG